MTATTEHQSEAHGKPVYLMGEVKLFPLIHFPWQDGATEVPQHPAYDAYLGGFLARAEQLIGEGCAGTRFSSPEVGFDQGYLYVSAHANIELLRDEDSQVYAAYLEWDALVPDFGEEPGKGYTRAENLLGHLLGKFIGQAVKDAGHRFDLHFEFEDYGTAPQ